MPPPHLHPRSRMTSSLFATTVFASFFVVVLPHVLPCPAPRITLADDGADGTPEGLAAAAAARRQHHQQRRRRRRIVDEADDATAAAAAAAIIPAKEVASEVKRGEDGMARFASLVDDGGVDGDDVNDGSSRTFQRQRRTARECPVPKPGGIVGELLGFKSSSSSSSRGPRERQTAAASPPPALSPHTSLSQQEQQQQQGGPPPIER